MTSSGPLSRVMADASYDDRSKVLEAVTTAFRGKAKDSHIKLGTKTWLVGAKNP